MCACRFVHTGTSDDVTVREGSPATLRCQVEGNPAPVVRFLKTN